MPWPRRFRWEQEPLFPLFKRITNPANLPYEIKFRTNRKAISARDRLYAMMREKKREMRELGMMIPIKAFPVLKVQGKWLIAVEKEDKWGLDL